MSAILKKSMNVRLDEELQSTTCKTISEVVVEYPQDWFSENPGKKPQVIVPPTKLSKDALSRAVYKNFIAQNAPSSLIRSYLYSHLQEISEICPDDWKSFGVTIARKGERVTVFGMLDVIHQEYPVEAVEGSERPNDEALIANILCICRMNTLRAGIATSKMATRLTERFVGIYGVNPYVPFSQGKSNFRTWANDSELLKLVAAIDMFFFRFSSHSLARYRLGTIVFRYRACAAMQSLLYVVERKAMKSPADLIEWIWSERLLQDIDRLYLKDTAEAVQPYSYFPYFVTLGISKKSPYSVTANPAIHAYCQAINVASLDIRGINARLVIADGMNEILENGLMTAYALSTGKKFEILFVKPEDVERAREINAYFKEKDEVSEKIVTKGEPKNRSAKEWYTFFENGGKQSQKYKKWKLAVMNQIVGARVGSFAEYMKRYLALTTE